MRTTTYVFVQRAFSTVQNHLWPAVPSNHTGHLPLQQPHSHNSLGLLLAIQSNGLFGSWPNCKRCTVLVLWLRCIAEKKSKVTTMRISPLNTRMTVQKLKVMWGSLSYLVGDLSEDASWNFLTILPSSSFMSSATALLTAVLFLPGVVALGTTGTPLLSSYEELPQSSEFDSDSLTEAILGSISNIFFCKMLKSVAWLGERADGCWAKASLGFVWTRGFGLESGAGSFGACGIWILGASGGEGFGAGDRFGFINCGGSGGEIFGACRGFGFGASRWGSFGSSGDETFGACGSFGFGEGSGCWAGELRYLVCVGAFCVGGSGGRIEGGGSTSSSKSSNSGGGGSNGTFKSSLPSSCRVDWSWVTKLLVLFDLAILSGPVRSVWSLTSAGLPDCVGLCILPGFAMLAYKLFSCNMFWGVREGDELDLGVTAEDVAVESLGCMLASSWSFFLYPFSWDKTWFDLCLSLSLAAINRASGDAAWPSRAAFFSWVFKLRSLRSNNGLNLWTRLGDCERSSLLDSGVTPELFGFWSWGDVWLRVWGGLLFSTEGESGAVLSSLFASGRGEGDWFGIATRSFSSCTFLETGLGCETTVDLFPLTWTSTGLGLTDPESSRSNICFGFGSCFSKFTRKVGLGIL